MNHLTSLYLGAGVLTFLAYGADKLAAIRGRRRVPEIVLHLMGVAGGWPGGFLAQQIFRHKTKKTSFRIAFWATAAVNSACLALF